MLQFAMNAGREKKQTPGLSLIPKLGGLDMPPPALGLPNVAANLVFWYP